MVTATTRYPKAAESGSNYAQMVIAPGLFKVGVNIIMMRTKQPVRKVDVACDCGLLIEPLKIINEAQGKK